MNTLISTEDLTREEWLEWRQKGIGGSDASVICGINKYKSPMELWMEKTGQIEAVIAGEAAYWGIVLEPVVRDEFAKRTGLQVYQMNHILQHSEYPFMLANIDGYVYDEVKKEFYIFEAKTASAFSAHEWDTTIPEAYMLQVQHYLAVTELNGAHVAVLIGGNTFKHFFIPRDDELIALLIALETQFWDCVVSGRRPKIDGSQASTDLLNRLYPQGKLKDIIELPENAVEIIHNYEQAQADEKAAAERKDEAANVLREMLGDNEKGSIAGRMVSWTNVSTDRLDTKVFKAEMPDIYAKYLTNSISRRFSIK